MAMKKKLFTPWSSLDQMLGKLPLWWPEEDQQRIATYEKYDQMYWNDPTQYALRVLEDEQPLYIPNARQIVNTTSMYLMKGLEIVAQSDDAGASPMTAEDARSDAEAKDKSPAQRRLDNFFKRERFYSKFNQNKQAGVARGDSAFHITGDPEKPEGSRVSIDTLHPGMVWKVTDDDDPDKIIRIHIVTVFVYPKSIDPEQKEYIRKLTYHKWEAGDEDNPAGKGAQRIGREEAIYEISGEKGFWFGPTPELKEKVLELELLDPRITQFPVYWFNNIEWEGQDYGSSELRGLEFLEWAVSQGATDTQMALALEGLGVYATDGGRPVADDGSDSVWEVAPGKVMEVPAGSYFRRVEGVGSITPMMEQLKYLESKMFGAAGMTDVALGQVDVQVAQSGIALAIKFMPTLARIEDRDTAFKEGLQQMFYDLKFWFEVYDPGAAIPSVDVLIDKSKLPVNRTERLNELNNMIDRKIISIRTYRIEISKLGIIIPADEDKQIAQEAKEAVERAQQAMPPQNPENGDGGGAGSGPNTSADGSNTDNVDNSSNSSNNRNRPNESSGTEA